MNRTIDRILTQKFHIRWVFLCLTVLMGMCVYGLTQAI